LILRKLLQNKKLLDNPSRKRLPIL